MAFNRLIEVAITIPQRETITIDNLRISFNIIKSDTETANTATISIYNLSRESASKIAKKGNNIALRAGYQDEGGIKNIFFGIITKAINRNTQTEIITEIECEDGLLNIQEKIVSLSYGIGTPIQQVFNDIIREFGLPLTNRNYSLIGQYANGYSFIGKAKDALTEVLARAGYSWTIQNQQIVIIVAAVPVQRTGLLISSQTGLLKTPELLEDIDDKPVSSDIPKRWKLKSLLYPQLFPGVSLQLESSVINGNFIVEKIESKGDNWQGEFISELEVVQI